MQLVDCKAIPDLVQLLRVGSPYAMEMAAAGLADIAHGCVLERQARAMAAEMLKTDGKSAVESNADGGAHTNPQEQEEAAEVDASHAMDRLLVIPEAGGIMPLVALLSTGTSQAQENAAAALWHLALEKSNQGVGPTPHAPP